MKQLITPAITRDVLKELRSILQERLRKAPAEAQQLAAETAKLKREICWLTDALASSDEPPDPIVQAIASRLVSNADMKPPLAD